MAKAEQISRNEFLKGVSASALLAAAGITAVGMGGTATAQAQTQSYTDEHKFKTLAAVVDTIVPTVKTDPPTPIPIFGVDANGDIFPLPVEMTNLGSTDTNTPGAAFIPPHNGDFVPPAYPFFCLVLPQLSHDANIIDLLIGTLDDFAEPFTPGYDENNPTPPFVKFMDLSYEERYEILYAMDKPDILVSKIPLEEAVKAKQLATITIYATYFIYCSELCNVIPKPVTDPDTGEIVGYEYKRNEDNTWDIIPMGAWNQMGYPGPSYKEPSYASTYDGLRVTIADGKVKIQ